MTQEELRSKILSADPTKRAFLEWDGNGGASVDMGVLQGLLRETEPLDWYRNPPFTGEQDDETRP